MSKKPRKTVLDDDEVGCITCSRWMLDSPRCNWCKKFSEWQGVEQVNKRLIEKGLTPYEDAKEMRYHNLHGDVAWVRYRFKRALARKKKLEKGEINE